MRLIELDLTKTSYSKPEARAKGLPNNNDHPDINTKDFYLCKIGGGYFVGKLSETWYGLSFYGWNDGLQYDKPGTNRSRWEKIWRIEE